MPQVGTNRIIFKDLYQNITKNTKNATEYDRNVDSYIIH